MGSDWRRWPVLLATATQATPITRTYNVSSDTYSNGLVHGFPPPTDPVTASITVTFDPTVNVTDQIAGIILNSTNLPSLDASPIAFTFDTGTDQLEFGLLEDGANAVNAAGTTHDFTYWIHAPESGTPTFSLAEYSADNDVYGASDGKVGFTAPAAVPEPGSLALLLSGLAGCALLARRRRRLTA